MGILLYIIVVFKWLPDGKIIMKDNNLYQGRNIESIITSSTLPPQFVYTKITNTIDKKFTKSATNTVSDTTVIIDFAQKQITPIFMSILFHNASFSLKTMDEVNYLSISMQCTSVGIATTRIDNQNEYTCRFSNPYGSILNSAWIQMGTNYAIYGVEEMPANLSLSCTYQHGISGRDYELTGRFNIHAQYTIYLAGIKQ